MLTINLDNNYVSEISKGGNLDFSPFGKIVYSFPLNTKFVIEQDKDALYIALQTSRSDCANCCFFGKQKFCSCFECNVKNRNGLKYFRIDNKEKE